MLYLKNWMVEVCRNGLSGVGIILVMEKTWAEKPREGELNWKQHTGKMDLERSFPARGRRESHQSQTGLHAIMGY